MTTPHHAARPEKARTSAVGEPEVLVAGPHEVVLTHPERVLFPEDGLTKGDLVRYYRAVAPWLLPYLSHRPLTLQRWPEGIEGPSFFEKAVPRGAPPWIETTDQPTADGRAHVRYPLANDASSLLWFANLSAITMHVWMSRVDTVHAPDFLVFDLDPFEGCAVRTLARVALLVRDELAGVGLTPLVKTTGGKGLHLVVPLAGPRTYEDGRAFGELLARRVLSLAPDDVTIEHTKSDRARGSVYFDWAQMGLGKTLVPPYTVRGRPGAPVSTPIPWADVEGWTASRTRMPTHRWFRQWNITNVPAILAEKGDLWAKPFRHGVRLAAVMERAARAWKIVRPA